MKNLTSVALKGAAPLAALLIFALPIPAQALTMKECGAKYQAAKADGTLKAKSWNAFRKAECGDEDVSADDAAAAEKEAPSMASAEPVETARVGKVTYPRQISTKYADESPGKARMHTCLDQYNANKAANGGTAPMKWITKGGGYYSLCNKRLKGA